MKIKHSVRQSLIYAALLLSPFTHLPGGIGPSCALAEILPDIEAHQFRVIPLEKSKTGRVYRFKTETQELPRVGNIVLIEVAGKPIMAFRVLKNDSEIGEFIGKRVRRYDTVGELKLNERYGSAEKLADLVAPPPPEGGRYDPNARPELDPAPGKSLSNSGIRAIPELDPLPGVGTPTPAPTAAPVVVAEVPPVEIPAASPAEAPAPEPTPESTPEPKTMDVEAYDDDLDSSTSPQNLQKGDGSKSGPSDSEDPDSMTDARSELEVDETAVLSPFKHMLGISLGVFRNMSNFNIPNNTPHNAFTGYFSHQLDRRIFVTGRSPQDSLSMEYGFTYYTRLNENSHNDDYTLLPLRAELRYDLYLTEAFSFLAFAGVQYNLILATQNVSTTSPSDIATTNRFKGFQPTFGAGFLYNIGPQWYLRGDLGLDRFAFGLAVKW